MADYKSLSRKKMALMDGADGGLLNSIRKAEGDMMDRLRKALAQIANANGKFTVAPEDYNAVVNSLVDAIRKGLDDADYNSAVSEYLRNFDQIDDLNLEIQFTANDIDLNDIKAKLGAVRKEAIDQAVTKLAGEGMNQAFIQPVREAMYRQIVSGASVESVEEYLKAYIKGVDGGEGRLMRYAGQVARDSVYQYDGAINQMIATEYGLNAYEYVGSVVEGSRPQCERWVALHILPISKLDSIIAKGPNEGLIPGTSASNFAINRGGYNCRHLAIPRRLSSSELKEAEAKV